MMKVCAIVVTYNRREELLRCIGAVLDQSRPVAALLVVDNASIDNTWEAVKERYGVNTELPTDTPCVIGHHNGVELIYLRSSRNRGGAGGFSLGLRSAHRMDRFDAFWMMDDDGYPSCECLERQMLRLKQSDYVMPASIDIEDHDRMSWPTRLKKGGKSLSYSELKRSWGEIMEFVYPFNGSLLSRKLVDEVGYVNEKLFIWGDEYEHYWRCREKGFHPVTVLSAEFYHPSGKMSFVPLFFGLLKVPFAESDLRMICLVRNYTYIDWKYGRKYKIPLKFMLYTWFFLVTRKWDMHGYKLYLQCVKDGLTGNFARHLKYIK